MQVLQCQSKLGSSHQLDFLVCRLWQFRPDLAPAATATGQHCHGSLGTGERKEVFKLFRFNFVAKLYSSVGSCSRLANDLFCTK